MGKGSRPVGRLSRPAFASWDDRGTAGSWNVRVQLVRRMRAAPSEFGPPTLYVHGAPAPRVRRPPGERQRLVCERADPRSARAITPAGEVVAGTVTMAQHAAAAPVVVVGASLGGLAAAVRLAKLGHRVVVVDSAAAAAPDVPDLIELPAAWRDLFRKSGRILDAVLTEAGLDLVPAPGRLLSDGTVLPTDRGDQYAALSSAYGTATADSWRDLLDALDDDWQLVRRAGLESELDPADPGVARLLADRTTIADLAARIAPPALAEVVLAVARDCGVEPGHAPAWWATRLCVRRTFGVWQVVSGDDPQPGSRLAELLLARATRRGVERVTGTAGSITPDGERVEVAMTSGERLEAAAVVSGVDLWGHRRLLGVAEPAVARRLGPVRLSPHPLSRTPTDRPAWEQPGTWRALEPVSGPGRVWYTGSGTVAGDAPWARLLVGALATYGVHAALTGTDVRPVNRSGHRPRAATSDRTA